MAADPAFAATPVIGAGNLTAAETTLNVPTAAVTILTAGSAGTKIEEINVIAVTTSAANLVATSSNSQVYLFVVLDSGPTYHLRDTIPVTAVTASTTIAPFQSSRTYTNLWIPSGWSLRASISVAPPANNAIKVEAFGGNY